MDFLLILLAIGGIVVAIVMFVLAGRSRRQEAESHARVETLQAIATGSVLFAMPNAVPDTAEPPIEAIFPSESATTVASEPVLFSGAIEPAREEDLDLALYELADEDELADERVVAGTREVADTVDFADDVPPARAEVAIEQATPPPVYQPSEFAMPASAFPFVLTVSAAGACRGQVSFQRTRRRSRS